MRFLKYNIPDWQTLKAKIFTPFEDGGSYNGCDVAIMGELKPGMTAVDILWHEDEHPDFEKYRVYPEPCGVHSFAGMEYLYEVEYENRPKDLND